MFSFKKHEYSTNDIIPSQWVKLRNNTACQKIAKLIFQEYQQKLELDPTIKLKFDKISANGIYDHETKTLYINPMIFTQHGEYSGIAMLNTMAHEAKHAWQYQMYDNLQQHHHKQQLSAYNEAILIALTPKSYSPYLPTNNTYTFNVQITNNSIKLPSEHSRIYAMYPLQPAELDAFTYAMKETYCFINDNGIEINDPITKNRILSGPDINSAIVQYINEDKNIAKHVRQIYLDMSYQKLQEPDIQLFITLERAMILTHMVNCNNKDQKTIDALLSDKFYTTETERLTELIHNMPERDDDEVIYEDEPDYVQKFQYGTREFQQSHHINEDKETQEQPSHEPSFHDDDEIDFP